MKLNKVYVECERNGMTDVTQNVMRKKEKFCNLRAEN